MKNTVKQDQITSDIAKLFDYEFDGSTSFEPPVFSMPSQFQIGLIVGPSGSGKSTILGQEDNVCWRDGECVASHFESSSQAAEKLTAVGLNSIPSWLREYRVLSTGEKFRADLARRLKTGARIDEFTSVVDRTVAVSCANAVGKYIRNTGLQNVVFASCHYDIIEWLQPDWVFDTETGMLSTDKKKDQKQSWRYFLAGSRHGQCSATIIISQRTLIKVQDAGLQLGKGSQLALPLQ